MNNNPSTDMNNQQFYNDALKAVIIKWSVIGGLFAILLLWAVVGHLHARRRLQKNLPLLRYHKYLVSASKVPSPYAANSYVLHRVDDPNSYAPPPPAYDPAAPSPPSYQPPSSGEAFQAEEPPKPTPSQLEEQTAKPPKKSFLPKSWGLGRNRD